MGVGKGGGGGGAGDDHSPPPGFSRSLSKTSQISKILQFLVVKIGSILIGPRLKNVLPTPLPETSRKIYEYLFCFFLLEIG